MAAVTMRVAGLALIVIAAVTACACEPRPGRLRDQWEQSNDRFRVRVETYDEGNRAHMFEPGCHVMLQSAPVGGSTWRQFGRAYFSKCDQNLKDRVRFVNARVAFVFLQWWYSVTVDEGRSWSTWDVAAHMPGKAFYNPQLIEAVTIDPNGTGTMTLNPEGVAGQQRVTLATNDYGKTWTVR